LHAFDLSVSKLAQDLLIAVKVVLLAGFVVIGLWVGSWEWPQWSPPETLTAGGFAGDLFYVAFAFSGWNAAIYAAEQFRDPGRDVPRAMLIGCGLVGVFYLIVNWVFVANITPQQASAVLRYEQDYITLAHVVADHLLGPTAATFVSILAIIAFVSAISAMMMVGPRIASSMAHDGLLPRVFAERDGRPPVGSVLLQGGVAVALLWSHSVRAALTNVGAIIVLFSALTISCLFWIRPRARPEVLVCGAVYVALSAWMLYYGFRNSPSLLVWTGAVAVIAVAAWLATGRTRGRDGAA
jgi:APA family basic amino acid/polyamine antiporter